MTNTDNLKRINVTNLNGFNQLYVDGLIILKNIKSVYYQGAIYRVSNNEIATTTGRKSILSLVQRGEVVYFLS